MFCIKLAWELHDFSVFGLKLIILMYLVVIKVLKLKQQAAISFPLRFLKIPYLPSFVVDLGRRPLDL